VTYFEQLKHPLWQKKRLELMNLASFWCQQCYSDFRQLHVHHSYYQKGLLLWEYPNDAYQVLCEICHPKRDEAEKRLLRSLHHAEIEELNGLADLFDVIGRSGWLKLGFSHWLRRNVWSFEDGNFGIRRAAGSPMSSEEKDKLKKAGLAGLERPLGIPELWPQDLLIDTHGADQDFD